MACQMALTGPRRTHDLERAITLTDDVLTDTREAGECDGPPA